MQVATLTFDPKISASIEIACNMSETTCLKHMFAWAWVKRSDIVAFVNQPSSCNFKNTALPLFLDFLQQILQGLRWDTSKISLSLMFLLALLLASRVFPLLVQIDEKNNIISKTWHSVHRRHTDDESKKIIDKCVNSTVCKPPPWQMFHRLLFIVDEQLWRHQSEAKRIDKGCWGLYKERPPRFVTIIRKRVD